jgi:hypothetical protein
MFQWLNCPCSSGWRSNVSYRSGLGLRSLVLRSQTCQLCQLLMMDEYWGLLGMIIVREAPNFSERSRAHALCAGPRSNVSNLSLALSQYWSGRRFRKDQCMEWSAGFKNAKQDVARQKVHLYSGCVKFSYPESTSPWPDIRRLLHTRRQASSSNSEQPLTSSNTDYLHGKNSLLNKWRRQTEHPAVRASYVKMPHSLRLYYVGQCLLSQIYLHLGSPLYFHLQDSGCNISILLFISSGLEAQIRYN